MQDCFIVPLLFNAKLYNCSGISWRENNTASILRIHKVSLWFQFGPVHFLGESFVATKYFRIHYMQLVETT